VLIDEKNYFRPIKKVPGPGHAKVRERRLTF
jgi:hypothetical protein